ncbi:MAG: hypothetical protein JW704_10950 [Anaerolineaceae bacterium]|nr:hypothetical protein [Anaerolineaceae bacterium]MBN2677256.1 hypothetical protein [Anaerolineaceae bacterium]
MKTRLSLLAIVTVLVVVTLACGAASDLSTVSDTGKAFMAALEKSDHTASWSLLDPAVQQEIGTYEDWIAFATPYNFTDVKFSATNVENTQATMEGTAVLDGDKYDVLLVLGKSGENWLLTGINFNLK